jgi:hypothetical protein
MKACGFHSAGGKIREKKESRHHEAREPKYTFRIEAGGLVETNTALDRGCGIPSPYPKALDH